MTNLKEVMTRAHKLAKTFTGNYQARLSLALKIAWASVEKGAKHVLELTGSEKQIKWAESIREKLYAKIEEGWEVAVNKQLELDRPCRAERIEQLKEEIFNVTDSVWFIENAKNDRVLLDYLNDYGIAGRLLAREI